MILQFGIFPLHCPPGRHFLTAEPNMVNPGLQRYLTNSPAQWLLIITAFSGLPGSPQLGRTKIKQQMGKKRLQRSCWSVRVNKVVLTYSVCKKSKHFQFWDVCSSCRWTECWCCVSWIVSLIILPWLRSIRGKWRASMLLCVLFPFVDCSWLFEITLPLFDISFAQQLGLYIIGNESKIRKSLRKRPVLWGQGDILLLVFSQSMLFFVRCPVAVVRAQLSEKLGSYHKWNVMYGHKQLRYWKGERQ